MIIPIYWGTRGKLKKDLSTGIDYCPNCRKFTGWFLGRSLKIYHFEYIPLKSKTLSWFHMCGVCEHGKTIDEGQYNVLKQMYLPFCDKKKQIECYERAAALSQTLPPEENSVNILMSNLAQAYPVSATPQLDQEYRRRLRKLLNVPAPEQTEPVRSTASAAMPEIVSMPQAEMPAAPTVPQNSYGMPQQAAGMQNAFAGANSYGAPAQNGMQNPYGAPAQNGMQKPYGAPVQNGMQNPYGAPVQNGMQNPYGVPVQNGMQNPYGAPVQNPYGSPAPYSAAPASGSAHTPNSQFTNSSDFD